MAKYAIIKNRTDQVVSVNFPESQIQDFALGPFKSTTLLATPEIVWHIQYGVIKEEIDKGRLFVIFDEPSVQISLSDLTDCDGYGTGENNVVRGNDPRIQALGSVPVSEQFTLSANQINVSKLVNLTYTPVSGFNVVVAPMDGPLQYSPNDFTVTGTVLSWDGLGMDGILEENDILIVNYRRDA